MKDTIPVRRGEELDLQLLEKYLREKLPDLPQGQLQVEQFPSGHSNLTYSLSIGPWEAVLRKRPLGPVASKAHDMNREYKILKAIHPYFQIAPMPYLYESDSSITGSEFFVMERRHGVVFDTEYPKEIEETEENGRKISDAMVKNLVKLHSIDYTKTELVDMAKPEGFLERQVHGWIKRYENAKTDDVQRVDQLTQWLKTNIPESPSPTIIHYDFKPNNAMFDPNDLTKMVGLFDWEMTTVGDPLADLGVTLSYWVQGDDPELLKYGFGKPPITTKAGFYSREEFAKKYADMTGADLTNLPFYVTFAYFKLAVIAQQIYFRYKKGQTEDPRFARFNQAVAALVEIASTRS
ncbi:phosphotransferase family protein [Bacillaceae bacterium S4-13-56]